MDGFCLLLLMAGALHVRRRRYGQSNVHAVFQTQSSIARIVLHTDSATLSRGPEKRYRLFGAGQARVAIERDARGHDLNGIAVRWGASGPQTDQNFAFATNLSRRRNEITGARA